jgi:hypothetical protein
MTPDQISEAKKRVAAFIPRVPGKDELPEPSWVGQIKLSGLIGAADHRMAIIGKATFSQGEIAFVKVAGKSVNVRCLEICENSVLVAIDGIDKPREIVLSDAEP